MIVENYTRYIQAIRAKEQDQLDELNESGFKPNIDELEQLIATYEGLQQELFNKKVTIALENNGVSRQLYIKDFSLDEGEKVLVVDHNSLSPANKKRKLCEDERLRTEKTEEEDQAKDVEKADQKLEREFKLSAEQKEQLSRWIAETKQNDDLDHSLLTDFTTKAYVYHGATCVNAALKHIGYANGIGGVFSEEQIASINEEKHALIFFSLPTIEITVYQDLGFGDKVTEQQVALINQQLASGQKAFIRHAITSLFDQANKLTQKVDQSPPLRMVNAAFAGLQSAYALQNSFNAFLNEPAPEVLSDADLRSQASSLISYNQDLLDRAFSLGRMYNAHREQQVPAEQSFCFSAPKPNC